MAYKNSSSFAKMFCDKSPFKKAFEKHSMYKGKAHVVVQNHAGHKALEEIDWGHSPHKKLDEEY